MPSEPLPDWTLRCARCGTESVYSERALLDRLWAGWPTCCGADTVLLPVEEPRPDVTCRE